MPNNNLEPDGFVEFHPDTVEESKNIWKWKLDGERVLFPFIYFRVSQIERLYLNIKHEEEIFMDGEKKILRSVKIQKSKKRKNKTKRKLNIFLKCLDNIPEGDNLRCSKKE